VSAPPPSVGAPPPAFPAPAAADLAAPDLGGPNLSPTLPWGSSVAVVGESFYEEAFLRVCGPKCEHGYDLEVVAELWPEPDNPYDSAAVAVRVQGHKVGHLSREDARVYRTLIDEALSAHGVASCHGQIRGGWDRGGGDAGNFGVWLRFSDRSWTLSPPADDEVRLEPGGAVSVSNEERYQDVLIDSTGGRDVTTRSYPVLAELVVAPVNPWSKTPAGPVLEVRLAGRTVGFLTAAMSARYLPVVEPAVAEGKRVTTEASLYTGTKKGRGRHRDPSTRTRAAAPRSGTEGHAQARLEYAHRHRARTGRAAGRRQLADAVRRDGSRRRRPAARLDQAVDRLRRRRQRRSHQRGLLPLRPMLTRTFLGQPRSEDLAAPPHRRRGVTNRNLEASRAMSTSKSPTTSSTPASCRLVAEDRVRVHELEGIARSMAVGPLPSDQVARLLRSYRELAKEQAEVKAQLVRLAPAWAELRKVLNELNGVLED
jgi:HIRAN domain